MHAKELSLKPDARVAILLCTRNAERFLHDQMDSFFAQNYDNWELWVSDDASSDKTHGIIAEYMGKGKDIILLDGPCRGATENFLSIARRVETDAKFFAWSDADDIWHSDKLARAVRHLQRIDGEKPALYCGRTEVVNRENTLMHLSPLFTRPPDFRNSLSQNIGGGNTMVFNAAARELLRQTSDVHPVAHDWWLYIITIGSGGRVFYDPEPCLRYRQHGANLTGENQSLPARFNRASRLLKGFVRQWNEIHVDALERHSELLTEENREVLRLFALATRSRTRAQKLRLLKASGVHRQSRIHTVALYLAAAMGRYP